MVLSTRIQNIAEAAGIPIEFGPRDAEGDISRAILLEYAGISEEDLTGWCEKSEEAIGNILRTCSGIPLTLGVAGRAVRTKAQNCNGDLQTAIVMYAEELERSIRTIITRDIEGYPNFCATVRASLDMVDEWAQKEGICGGGEALACSDLFTRMNVFSRRSRIPENAVKKLWGDVDYYDVDGIIEKLVDLNLLSKGEDKKSKVSLGLHDLVLEYCVMQARRNRSSFHCDFLSRYLTSRSATVGDSELDKLFTPPEPRAWWSLPSDGYFPENVCRHLWKGGCVGELMALLCDVRWTTFRMRCDALLEWKSDFESLTSAVSELKKENGNGDGWDMVEDGFQRVKEAVNEAWVYLNGNQRELGMQVHSRLFDVEAEVWPVSRYLRSVHAHCEKPWLVPLGRYGARPGTGASVELLVDVSIASIAMTKNRSVVAVGVDQEVLVMDVESRSILWRGAGHDGWATCVAMSGDGTMIVSGSHDGTLRRWDGRSGAPVGEPLRGHDNLVRCVAMSGDGTMIVSGSDDGTLRRWDGRSGAPVGEPLCGHDDWVSCVAMSGDGAMIVSGSYKTLQLWDSRTGTAIGPLVWSPVLKSIEIENDFVWGHGKDGEVIRWSIDKTRGLVDEEKWEPSAEWFEDADRPVERDLSSSWVLKKSSRQLLWDSPTGVYVVATLPESVRDFLFFKRVSFRAGGIGDDDEESSYTVGAVLAVELSNRMFCMFHLVTE